AAGIRRRRGRAGPRRSPRDWRRRRNSRSAPTVRAAGAVPADRRPAVRNDPAGGDRWRSGWSTSRRSEGDDSEGAPRRLTRRCSRRLANAPRLVILKWMLQYQQPLDLAFQALSDPTRRRMLERLSVGPATVSELADPLPMSMSAVVQHL